GLYALSLVCCRVVFVVFVLCFLLLRSLLSLPARRSSDLFVDCAEIVEIVGVTVSVKVWVTLVSTPPNPVPPLSCTVTAIVVVPETFDASVYVSVPSAATVGIPPLEKSAALLRLLTVYVAV